MGRGEHQRYNHHFLLFLNISFIRNSHSLSPYINTSLSFFVHSFITQYNKTVRKHSSKKTFGQLVPLSYDISAFTPVAYQRHRL